MSVFGEDYFGVADYTVVVLTLLVSLGIGIYHSWKGHGKQTNDDLLLGGRKMAALPVGISLMVTYFSAIYIIGFPAEIYGSGIQLFFMNIFVVFFAMLLAACTFVSVFYKLKLTSVFEYFEYRFESVAVRCFASGLTILSSCVTGGIVLYAPSIPVELFLGLPSWVTILSIGTCGTIYASIGGLKAVVWADVFQFVLIMIGMVAIVSRGFVSGGGVLEAFNKASEHGRLTLFNWNVDPFEKYNTLNYILGHGFVNILFFGTHQQTVQRYSSLPTFKEAIKAMAWYAVLKKLSLILIILAGIAIFATYAGCDPILLGEIKKQDEIVPYFFIKQLSWIPGMMGLVTSCILSAVLSTTSSQLNSLAALTWKDFLSQISCFERMGPTGKGRVTIVLSALFGVIIMIQAFFIGEFGTIFQIRLIVIGVFEGALGGCFLLGMFLPFVDKVGAMLGMVAGIAVTGFLTYQAKFLTRPPIYLPTSIETCPADTDFSLAKNATVLFKSTAELEWPEKIYTISVLLYPLIGILVTVIVGSITSLISCCFLEPQLNNKYKYVHPVIKRVCRRKPEVEPHFDRLCDDCIEIQNTGLGKVDLRKEFYEKYNERFGPRRCSNNECMEMMNLSANAVD